MNEKQNNDEGQPPSGIIGKLKRYFRNPFFIKTQSVSEVTDFLKDAADQKIIDKLVNSIPELPDERKRKYAKEYNLSNYDASVLTADKSVSDYFDSVIKSDNALIDSAKIVANWITTELFSLLKEKNIDISNSPTV